MTPRRQIFLFAYGYWADIINESPQWYAAVDIDGVNTIVAKDGMERVRVLK